MVSAAAETFEKRYAEIMSGSYEDAPLEILARQTSNGLFGRLA